MADRIRVLHKKCDVSLAKDKSLPLNSYIVCYPDDDEIFYDIVQGSRVSIFDHYYDEYRKVISLNWTDGRVNPKVYGAPVKKSKK
jgi:hypothetical protein